MSLITNKLSILTCLLDVWISSLEKYLFKFTANGLNWVVGLFHIDLQEFIMDTSPLSVICIANIFSHGETYLLLI